MSTLLEHEVGTSEQTQAGGGQGHKSHIVKTPTPDKESGVALVMRARVEGIEIEALCGHRWVPQRDPKSLPLCDECKAIYEVYGSIGGWGDGSQPDA